MSELISGKEALIALANGEDVQASINGFDWKDSVEFGLVYFLNGDAHFRLKPRTITINGVEVPAPFKPKEGERFYYATASTVCGWSYEFSYDQNKHMRIYGAWRTEEEIKRVVAALKSIFNAP